MDIVMNWPQWVYVALWAIQVIGACYKLSQMRTPEGIGGGAAGMLIGAIGFPWLLYMGGFFS